MLNKVSCTRLSVKISNSSGNLCFWLKIYRNIQKNSSFENFESALYSTSVSMPLKCLCSHSLRYTWHLFRKLVVGYRSLWCLSRGMVCVSSQWHSQYGGKGGRVPPLTMKKLQKLGQRKRKSGKNQEKEEKSGRNGNNREGSFTLPFLTDRAGYATVSSLPSNEVLP